MLDVNAKSLMKGDYLAAVEFEGRVPMFTIIELERVMLESLGKDGDDAGPKKTRERGVLHFKETPRGWVLNSTNIQCLSGMFGERTGKWSGKRVFLYSTPVAFGGGQKDGIRIKGSPDIAATMDVTVTLPRKRPFKITIQKMPAATASTAPARPPLPLADVRVDAEPPPPEDPGFDREPGAEG